MSIDLTTITSDDSTFDKGRYLPLLVINALAFFIGVPFDAYCTARMRAYSAKGLRKMQEPPKNHIHGQGHGNPSPNMSAMQGPPQNYYP